MSKVAKFSKEDDAYLASYSNTVSAKGQAIFYLNALITTVAPIYLFTNINQIKITEQYLPLIGVALISIYALVFASKNLKHSLKHRIVMKRAEAVTREINKKFSDDKKMSKKEKDERVLFRRNEVAEEESTYLSVFIVNAFYVAITFIFAFVFLSNLSPVFTTVISIGAASGIVGFLSTSKQ